MQARSAAHVLTAKQADVLARLSEVGARPRQNRQLPRNYFLDGSNCSRQVYSLLIAGRILMRCDGTLCRAPAGRPAPKPTARTETLASA